MDAFTPAQTTELISQMGVRKAGMRLDMMFMNSFVGGALLGFGSALSLSTLSSPWFTFNAPGLIRTISAMVSPVGLIMVILTGSDLFTSYVLYSTVALLHRKITFLNLLKTWVVSFVGNLCGTLFFACLLVSYGGIFADGAYNREIFAFSTAKVVTPSWVQILLRGILAGWLVAISVFLSISSREIVSKIVAIWFPAMCFVGLGTDHVIANMYFVPAAIFQGAPDISVWYYIWKSMIPSCLGNAIGGSFFVGFVSWYLHLAWNHAVNDGPSQQSVYPLGGRVSHTNTTERHSAGTANGYSTGTVSYPAIVSAFSQMTQNFPLAR